MKENKVWGITSPIWNGNNVEFHRIEVKEGGYCSKHLHEHKFNMFYVEYGELEISIWKEHGYEKDEDMIDKTIIVDDESTIIEPKQYHMFKALKDTVAYEIYWVSLEKDDIKRMNQGGLIR